MRIDTLEFDSNFPYTAMFSSDSETYSQPIKPVSNISEDQKLNPVHHFGYTNTLGCPIANIQLSLADAEHKKVLKSVLARGIAVAGAMHTEGGTDAENAAFMAYSSGIFTTAATCSLGSTNH